MEIGKKEKSTEAWKIGRSTRRVNKTQKGLSP